MKLQEVKDQLIEWMNAMKHGYRDSSLYMADVEDDNEKKVKMRLFTEKNDYSIVAIPPNGDYKGYLGALASSRKSRAGEDWTRGNDLADGEFNRETWIEILGDIVGYELVKIHQPIERLYGKYTVTHPTG